MIDGLEGRRVLVVGASSGIGKAVATMAAKRGATVAAAARRVDRLAQLDALVIGADVRNGSDCRRMVDETVAAWGGLDAVVYTAGVSPLKPLAEATAEDWRMVMETNVVGAALVSAAAAPHLLESDGRVVLLSSKATRRPFADLALYTTSKIGLDGLIRCLPVDFPGLRVTRVIVGNTAGTEFAASWDRAATEAAVERWAESGVLGGGMMHVDQVAEAVLFALCASGDVDEISVIDSPDDDGAQPLV